MLPRQAVGERWLTSGEAVSFALAVSLAFVRALMGKAAIAADKLMFGSTLEVLGVVINLMDDRFTLCPCEKKLKKCLDVMRAALAEGGILRRGCASKLAGRLQWSTQYLFHRLGRAMLRPIFAQCHAGDRSVGSDLRVALSWWCKVLELGIVEERFWKLSEAPLAHMFVDAAGKSARYGPTAVACVAILFCACQVCSSAIHRWKIPLHRWHSQSGNYESAQR